MRRFLWTLSGTLCATTWLAACGGGGDGTTPPTGTPAITLSASASAGTVARGSSTPVTLTLGRVDGYSGAVSLAAEGAPTGVTVQFSPSALTGSTSSATATISVSSAAVAGTSTLTFRATGTGVTDKTVTYALTVPTPAITLAAGTTVATSAQGTTLVVPLTIARTNGATGPVTLTSSGEPANVASAFAPSSIPDGATTSTMTITVGAGAAVGPSTITVRAALAGAADQTVAIALTVTAAGTPAYTITAAPAALSLGIGQSGQSTMTLARSGGFAGNVTLSLEGAPAGVSGIFTPNPATANTSTLAISTTGAASPGVYPLTVRGTANGLADRTITLTLTVTATPGFSLTATAATIAQGAAGTSTISITRTGGFAGDVALSATNLPANVTPSFAPATVSGTSSTLTLTVGAGAAAGSYNVTVTGTGTGVANQTTTVPLTITTAGGGGSINWRFCDATRMPLWFAYRNGTNGAWVRVNATGGDTFSFSLTGGLGAVAYVQNLTGGGTQGAIFLFSAAELSALATNECVINPATKALSGSFAGLAAGQTGWAYVAGSTGSAAFPLTTFNMPEVDQGLTDLLAFRSTTDLTGTTTPDRMLMRRNVNYAASSAIPVIDFAGGVAPATANITIANAGADFARVSTSFQTLNGFIGGFPFGPPLAVGGVMPQYGVPAALTQAGDFHVVSASSFSGDGSSFRTVIQYNRDLTSRTITMGGTLNVPTVTVTGTSPYARIKVKNDWQAEYNSAAASSMSQSTGTPRSWTISGSRAYFTGSGEYEFELQDFSGVAGFQNIWGLASGVSTQISTNASNNIGTISEGAISKNAARSQTITP